MLHVCVHSLSVDMHVMCIQQNKESNSYVQLKDNDDQTSTSCSVTKSAKSLQIADGSKDGSLKSSPGSTSSALACSQAGNKDRSHKSRSSSGSISSMPECSQAAAATNGVCIVNALMDTV